LGFRCRGQDWFVRIRGYSFVSIFVVPMCETNHRSNYQRRVAELYFLSVDPWLKTGTTNPHELALV
jgi:hypothetical protein